MSAHNQEKRPYTTPQMRAARLRFPNWTRFSGGRAGLIVVSSSTAFLPVPRLAAYAASKAFALSLAEALAAELTGRPVDVLVLCPTATRSRFAERSGFGRTPPLAQSPAHVARRAL